MTFEQAPGDTTIESPSRVRLFHKDRAELQRKRFVTELLRQSKLQTNSLCCTVPLMASRIIEWSHIAKVSAVHQFACIAGSELFEFTVINRFFRPEFCHQ
jgi:hypothetical protein